MNKNNIAVLAMLLLGLGYQMNAFADAHATQQLRPKHAKIAAQSTHPTFHPVIKPFVAQAKVKSSQKVFNSKPFLAASAHAKQISKHHIVQAKAVIKPTQHVALKKLITHKTIAAGHPFANAVAHAKGVTHLALKHNSNKIVAIKKADKKIKMQTVATPQMIPMNLHTDVLVTPVDIDALTLSLAQVDLEQALPSNVSAMPALAKSDVTKNAADEPKTVTAQSSEKKLQVGVAIPKPTVRTHAQALAKLFVAAKNTLGSINPFADGEAKATVIKEDPTVKQALVADTSDHTQSDSVKVVTGDLSKNELYIFGANDHIPEHLVARHGVQIAVWHGNNERAVQTEKELKLATKLAADRDLAVQKTLGQELASKEQTVRHIAVEEDTANQLAQDTEAVPPLPVSGKKDVVGEVSEKLTPPPVIEELPKHDDTIATNAQWPKANNVAHVPMNDSEIKRAAEEGLASKSQPALNVANEEVATQQLAEKTQSLSDTPVNLSFENKTDVVSEMVAPLNTALIIPDENKSSPVVKHPSAMKKVAANKTQMHKPIKFEIKPFAPIAKKKVENKTKIATVEKKVKSVAQQKPKVIPNKKSVTVKLASNTQH